MIELKPEERDLIGKWELVDGKVVADATSARIETLVEEHLEKVASDPTGWDTLYRDPEDGRYWELTFPDSSWHGGGPPRLTSASSDHARNKYGIN
jgi:hypothetical protein